MNDIRPCGNNEKWCESCVSKGKCNYTKNQSIIVELEKIKANFVEQRKDFGLTKNDSDYDLGSFDSYNYAITTIDYRIAELKGE